MDSGKFTDPVFIARAAEVVIARGNNHNFSGTELAGELSLSREQTHRKIKKDTNLSTGKFICYIRLLKACRLIQRTSLTISEVSYKVGFESPAYFNKCFKDAFKINPGDLKRQGKLVVPAESEMSIFSNRPQILATLTAADCFPTFHTANENSAEIKGYNKSRMPIAVVLIVFVSILVSAYYLKDQVLKADVGGMAKVGRIGIVPFSNHTGDTLFTPLGDIASSWLSSRLDELEDVRIVPYLTMKAYSPYLGVLPDDPDGRPTLSEVVHASYFVSGSYYLNGYNLTVEAQVVDAQTQETIYSLPRITGSKDSAMQIIEKVRLKMAGVLSNFDDVKIGKLTPPNYDAYVHYLRGLTELESGTYPRAAQFHFEKASALEPDFVMPRLFLTWLYKDARLDSMVEVLQKMTNTTRYERNVCDEIYELYDRNYEGSLQIALHMLERYPQDCYFNMVAGHRAKSLFKPSLSLKVFSRLQDPFPDDFGKIWHYYKVWNTTESLLMLGKEEEAMEYLNSIPKNLDNPALPFLYIATYSKLGESPESIEKIIQTACRGDERWCADYYTAAAYEYNLRSINDQSRYFAAKAKGLMKELPDQSANLFDIIDVLYLSVDYAGARTILEREMIDSPDSLQLKIYLAYIETCTGNPKAGEKIFEKIESELIFWRRHEFQYHISYLKARMYALAGDQQKAVTYLKIAFEKGQFRHHWDFERDIFLKNLFEYPEFQRLVAPRD